MFASPVAPQGSPDFAGPIRAGDFSFLEPVRRLATVGRITMSRALKTETDLQAAMESIVRRLIRATKYAIEDGNPYDEKAAALLAKQIFEHLTDHVEDESPICTEPGCGARG